MDLAQSTKDRNRFFLVLLALLFLGPLIAAWSLYSTRNFIPETLSYGHLIQPPLLIQQLPLSNTHGKTLSFSVFQGHWTLLYINPNLCGEACENNLHKMQQIHKSLGKNAPRVQRVLITFTETATSDTGKSLEKLYPGTLLAQTRQQDLMEFLHGVPVKPMTLSQGGFYIVDPLGQVILSYPDQEKPRGIYNDLKRLLMVSNIG